MLFFFTSFFAVAQTEKQKTSSLKKWYDKEKIVVDGTVEEMNEKGELCFKVKINRVIKGNLASGYVNIDPSAFGRRQGKGIDPDYSEGSQGFFVGNRYLIRMVLSDVKPDCFITNNKGVYKIVKGDARMLVGDVTPIYQELQDFCGVNMGLPKNTSEKKTPISTQESKHTAISPADQKKYWEKQMQFIKVTAKNKLSHNQINSLGCQDLFISEYLDGNGNDKAIEIYNPTPNTITLTGVYSILIFHGSSYTPTTIPLTGSVAAYSTFILANNHVTNYILTRANQTDNQVTFNGKECIVLNKLSTHIDKIGEIGVSIGSGGWTIPPSGSTVLTDLRRKFTYSAGDTIWTNCKNEWSVLPKDSTHNFGVHTSICGIDPDFDMQLSGGTIVGNNFEFDVLGSSQGSDTYLDRAIIDINYSAGAFGSNIVAGGNVTITNGISFSGCASSCTYYDFDSIKSDLYSNTLRIGFGTNPGSGFWNRTLLTSTWVTLCHVSIKIQNCANTAGISLGNDIFVTLIYDKWVANASDNPNFASFFNYDNTYVFGAITTTIPCGLHIAYIYPDTVVGGSYYSGDPYHESYMTITGSGFGTNKGYVIMKNAVHSGTPEYITLDNIDIINWTPTQITVQVPSILYPTNPYKGNYPGTGYVYVRPYPGTDSVRSPSVVTIPYSLINKTLTNPVFKVRMCFAYYNVKDSSGTADTAQYCFRFDSNTIGNPSVTSPYCRPLLKQAIKDWACGLPIRYKIGKDTVIATTAQDGVSYISFKSSLTDTNFIAETSISGNYCSSVVYSSEADITFRLNPPANGMANWFYENPANVIGSVIGFSPAGYNDFFEIALHELGHASLLNHVNDTTDLMYFKIFPGGVRNYISTHDENGGTDNISFSKTRSLGGCFSYSPFTIPAGGSFACDALNDIKTVGESSIQIGIYPNPASDYLNITFSKKHESKNTIKIYDAIGQIVYAKNLGTNEGAHSKRCKPF